MFFLFPPSAPSPIWTTISNQSTEHGSRDFAILTQEADMFHDGTDPILAVGDVLIASEKQINNHCDWYAILQLNRRSDDLEEGGAVRDCEFAGREEGYRDGRRSAATVGV